MQDQAIPEHRRMLAVSGHPGVYRKGTRYLVRWRHQGRMKARSFRTLTEAVRFKASTVAGDTKPTSRQPFKRYAASWVQTYTGRTSKGVSASTRATYADVMNRVVVPFFKNTRLDQIDPPLIREFIAHLAAQGLAPGTVRRYVAVLRACLATAYEDGLIRSNPSVRVVVPGERKRKPKRLTPTQTRDLLAAMPEEHADLAYFLAATGCRISEALATRWCDLSVDDAGRPVISIPKSKTPSGERVIPLTPETMRRLTRRRAAARFAGGEHPIFPSADGSQMDPHNYRSRVFRPAAKKAGVPWATPHVLRHGVASLMAERGYSPSQIAAHLGHADGGVLALRTYIHADKLDTTEFLDEALSG